MSFRREDGAARIGSGSHRAAVSPGLEIPNGIDDAAAELAVCGAGAVGAVLFQRATGEAQEASGFGCAKEAWREVGYAGGHDRVSVAFVKAAGDQRRTKAMLAKHARAGGWGK